MAMTISGDSGVVFPNGSQLATQLGIFNRIIDGGFIINQRGYVSNTALSSGVYAHDRWKAGSGGCTYTFTQGSLGVNTTITITAGTLQQVIEGCNVPEGGTYTLSWTGTAQARINGGSYGASPLTVTGITAGANTTVEFATGTCGNVQFETGSFASGFAFRPYGTELALCQRYAIGFPFGASQPTVGVGGTGLYSDTNSVQCSVNGFNLYGMRTVPTTITATGTQGTDWGFQTSSGIPQTGFTLTTNFWLVGRN